MSLSPAYDSVGFITGDKIESWAQSQNKVSVTAVISVNHKIVCKVMKKISIGIDFSKETFDATIMCRVGDSFNEVRHCKFDNDNAGYRAFLKWVKTEVKCLPDCNVKTDWLFCGEHTGTCSVGLSDFLAKKRLFMWLESAYVIHRKCGIVREKNDKIDSKRIAEYALRNFSDEIEPYQLDSDDMKKLKALYAAHQMLTKDKVSKINQIKSGTLEASPLARHEIEKQLKVIDESLSKIDSQMKSLMENSEEFCHNYEILDSFKGAGPITIACMIIKTRNFKIMNDSRELGCHMGVTPHRCQSGTSVDKAPRTSRYRDRNANAAITRCAISAIQHNTVIKSYYERLVGRGVHYNKARNNCKFKIINILLAMIRNDKKFDIHIYGKSKELWMSAV